MGSISLFAKKLKSRPCLLYSWAFKVFVFIWDQKMSNGCDTMSTLPCSNCLYSILYIFRCSTSRSSSWVLTSPTPPWGTTGSPALPPWSAARMPTHPGNFAHPSSYKPITYTRRKTNKALFLLLSWPTFPFSGESGWFCRLKKNFDSQMYNFLFLTF